MQGCVGLTKTVQATLKGEIKLLDMTISMLKRTITKYNEHASIDVETRSLLISFDSHCYACGLQQCVCVCVNVYILGEDGCDTENVIWSFYRSFGST
jgi:hypothetical protein